MKLANAISTYDEVVAYETIWGFDKKGTFKSINETYFDTPKLPTEALKKILSDDLFSTTEQIEKSVKECINPILGRFSVSLKGDQQFPERLKSAKDPLEMFYYKGDINLLETKGISIVGARKVSEEGYRRATKITNLMINEGYTIISGLAEGVDTAAHTRALELGANTIGVIGTPIHEYYPKKNKNIQDAIAKHFLLISQVPFYRYASQNFHINRFFFPQRNVTMAALSEATIIIEASETSGSLIQARECLRQGKKLFILESCFHKGLKWPETYLKRSKNVIRVNTEKDIIDNL